MVQALLGPGAIGQLRERIAKRQRLHGGLGEQQRLGALLQMPDDGTAVARGQPYLHRNDRDQQAGDGQESPCRSIPTGRSIGLCLQHENQTEEAKIVTSVPSNRRVEPCNPTSTSTPA